MPKKSSSPQTAALNTIGTNPPPYTGRSIAIGGSSKKPFTLGHILVGVWAVLAALATASQVVQARYLERYAQATFFNLRGPVAAPADIVILAIDEYSLEQSKILADDDSQTAPVLSKQLTWPLPREIYAAVIERLMQAGARAVALDILLLDPSSYGPDDDAKLAKTLQTHAGKVVLAAQYNQESTRQGSTMRRNEPIAAFQTQPSNLGFINFWSEPANFWTDPAGKGGIIYRLGSQFPSLTLQANPSLAEYFNYLAPIPSFAEASLQAAQIPLPPTRGDHIFYFGPAGSFDTLSIASILEDDWQAVQNFKDKIVVIGGTAASLQDFHETPFGKMAGVEIHANAIATLKEQKAIAEAIPHPYLQGILVLAIVAAAALFQNLLLRFLMSSPWVRQRLQGSLFRFVSASGMIRFALATGTTLAWGGISYVLFVYGHLIVPTAIPMVAIVLSGTTYFAAASASDYQSKVKLLKILAQFPQSEVVRRIIDELDVEFQDLLQEPEQAFSGKRLKERYRITQVLGSGGFGRTYIAEDTDRPGNPLCVVKQLKPASDNPNLMDLARRLFKREAQTLEKLGKHDQIPQLLAYFEEDGEFYLVQEYIEGTALTKEMFPGKQVPEVLVVMVLRELLQILEFVHSENVIHRDIKPSNIIRRQSDGKLVLIDFGAVKIADHLNDEDNADLTVGIGTKGYMPSEQSEGKPRPNSDIYAVGMIGIQALTGLFPSKIREKEDPTTGEIVWKDKARVSQVLANIIDKMVLYDYRKRYQTTTTVLQDLKELRIGTVLATPTPEPSLTPPLLPDEPTRPWPQILDSQMPASTAVNPNAPDPHNPD